MDAAKVHALQGLVPVVLLWEVRRNTGHWGPNIIRDQTFSMLNLVCPHQHWPAEVYPHSSFSFAYGVACCHWAVHIAFLDQAKQHVYVLGRQELHGSTGPMCQSSDNGRLHLKPMVRTFSFVGWNAMYLAWAAEWHVNFHNQCQNLGFEEIQWLQCHAFRIYITCLANWRSMLCTDRSE